jgi:DNA-directed RNA polymerase subunit RPC12/RpoP
MEKCFNCGREMGNLEQAFIFQEKVVCGKCDSRLRKSNKTTILFILTAITIFIVAFCFASLYEETKKQESRKQKETLEQSVKAWEAIVNTDKVIYGGGRASETNRNKLSESETSLRNYEKTEIDATDRRLKLKWVFWITITGGIFFSGLIVLRK